MSFAERFQQNFLDQNRWLDLLKGLGTTLEITIVSVIIGIVLGFIIAIVKTTADSDKRFKPFAKICDLYLTVIRGTPVMVQLLIMYYIIMASSTNKVWVAMLTFGINSGAYVAEIVRSGIQSIDKGQFEAGRSLGFSYVQTMYLIIVPQAIKNVLPALMNELIVLLKETSVCGYIGLTDLTRAGDIIRSRTYEAFLPLIAVALIYLVIVCGLQAVAKKVERRLNASER